MSELNTPESWAKSPLKYLLKDKLTYGVLKPGNLTAEGVPMLRIEDLKAGYPNRESLLKISNDLSNEYKRSIVREGDVLLSVVGTLGKVITVKKDLVGINVSRAISVIRLEPEVILSNYFTLYINSPCALAWIKKRSLGSAQKVLNLGTLDELEIPLPPTGEQKRIVAKIESIQTKIKTIEQNVSNTKKLIEKYRESLLQKAFRGELVTQDPKDEPASELLKRIRVEREKNNDGKKKKNLELPPISPDEIPFKIPKNWEGVRLGEIANIKGGKRVPKGMSLVDEKTPYPYIRVTDMKDLTVRTERLKFLPKSVHDEIKNYKVSKNDIYITVAGTIGAVGIIPDELDNANLTENADKLTDYHEVLNQKFLLYMMTSEFVQNQIKNLTKQVAQPKLSVENINKFIVLVPPMNEQLRIVNQIEAAFLGIDKIKVNNLKLALLIEFIKNSILQNAFSGKLVPQIYSEGTGHELLNKIKNEVNKQE